VALRCFPNAAVRPREYLTGDRVERLIAFAKKDTRHRKKTAVAPSKPCREARDGHNPQTGVEM
jgi:hypothetical protein